MALIVQKYGGTSVGTVEKIKNVAKRVARTKEQGNDVVVVVSAMSGETNRLLGLAHQISEMPNERELDVVAATGEQVTIGLLAIALSEMGCKAKSFCGFQIPVLTDAAYVKARIRQIRGETITKALKEGFVAVVAGFQGIDDSGSITTLGRGGSDTSAVAVAAALKADVCEIYTDVDGVYTTDPNICADARKLDKISFEEMLELASLGAKVLQIRSVEFGMKYGVRIHVRSSFNDNQGTIVTTEEEIMETAVVSGVAYSKSEAKITVVKVPDRPGIAAKIFKPLSEANIVVDVIVQNVSDHGVHGPDVHDRAHRLQEGDADHGEGGEGRRGGADRGGRQDRQGLHRRHGDALPFRRGAEGVRDAGGGGDQHPRDLHLGDQGLRPHRGEVHRAGRARAPRGVRIGEPRLTAAHRTGKTGSEGRDAG